MQAKNGAGDHAESAEGAGGQLGQIVASDVLDDFAATAGKRAIRQCERDADDQVAQCAKTQAQCAAVIGGKDAADGGFFRPKRIKRETLAVLRQNILQPFDGASCFDRDGEIGPSMLDDSVQPRRRQN